MAPVLMVGRLLLGFRSWILDGQGYKEGEEVIPIIGAICTLYMLVMGALGIWEEVRK